jgi:hypothetical protein
MPKYTAEDWFEDDTPYVETPVFTNHVSVVTQSLPRFEMVNLDPVELKKSQEVGRAAWQRYRDEIESQIKSVFVRPEEATLKELVAYMDWMMYGVVRYGYADDDQLSNEQIHTKMEVVYKYMGSRKKV